VRGYADAAIGRLRAVHEVEAGRAALDQVHLERLAFSLLYKLCRVREVVFRYLTRLPPVNRLVGLEVRIHPFVGRRPLLNVFDNECFDWCFPRLK
jgi:hypothetical protein